MEKKLQEIFFKQTVDTEEVTKLTNEFVEAYQKSDNPHVRIELVPLTEEQKKSSYEDLLKEIDDQLREKEFNKEFNFYRVWTKGKYAVILGFQLQ